MNALLLAAALLVSPSAPKSLLVPPGSEGLPAQVRGMISTTIDKVWNESDRYFHDGDYNRVVALCRLLVEADPDFDEAYSSAAWLLWSMNESESANALLARGVELRPKSGILFYELGYQLFRTKRYADALPHLKRAVELGNVPAFAYATLAHCYTKLNKLEDAVATWKACVAKFPDFASGQKNLKDAEERLKKSGKP